MISIHVSWNLKFQRILQRRRLLYIRIMVHMSSVDTRTLVLNAPPIPVSSLYLRSQEKPNTDLISIQIHCVESTQKGCTEYCVFISFIRFVLKKNPYPICVKADLFLSYIWRKKTTQGFVIVIAHKIHMQMLNDLSVGFWISRHLRRTEWKLSLDYPFHAK